MTLGPDFWRLADRFLEFLRAETGFPLIICDETGTIVKAVDRSRIGQKHAGAQRILRGEVDEAAVTAEEAAANPLVREGYSCPVVVDGRRAGTFGITGPLALSKPLARVAATVLAAWVEELDQQRRLQDAASKVSGGVQGLVARLGTLARESSELVEGMEKAAGAARERLAATDDVVSGVQQIALQSRILSINGAVEASRAGERGRAFAVISKDMLRLAEDARGAAGDVQKTLSDAREAIGSLDGAIARAAAGTKEQLASLAEVGQLIGGLRAAVDGLAASLRQDGAPGAPRR
ncbi:sugar diacid recognition domain-containing protein [Anaeromyxobacter paludicola]|uniref:Methyl-accepting transducer domain-containing protein n=1 Tax=Anaeromyxobacter paludicola TaxID=2918171 RepID=A0ABM7XDM4_9BACT|nr:sugar diacid recognition domain-containing protein [Anaeromyxobacter paludicola]BDG09982.1 hypothetical protein AMPC_30950 [Anaeromyxobacter paludicola]